MLDKEAKARIKINKLLEEAGWRFFDDEQGKANILLESSVKMEELGDVDDKWGIINRQGNWIILPIYKLLTEISGTLFFKAAIDHKYGYIDINEKWKVAPVYDYLNNYHDFFRQDLSNIKRSKKEEELNDERVNDYDDWEIQPQSFDDWLNDEFGEDAETAFWNMD